MPVVRRLSTALAWAAAVLCCSQARAQQAPGPRVPSAGPTVILDVPYLPQSVLLCGGAAVAMVERWWGRRGVYAGDFAALIRPAEGGIRTTDLAAAARDRGWDTRLVAPTPEAVRTELGQGVPVVALIEVGRNRYHFVVLLSWNAGRVIFHDPARAPRLEMDEAEFLRRWAGGDSWAMTIRPGPVPQPEAASPPQSEDPTEPLPCSPWLARALAAADADRLNDAGALLAEAREHCPDEPRVLRELAGVRFREGLHREAALLAEDYLTRVPDDELGWQLLAAARFLGGDPSGALAAWNETGRPTVDLVRLDGIRRIRFQVVAGAMSLPPGTLLTPERLTLARRRMEEIPAIRSAVVRYEPVAGGLAEVLGAAIEQPVLASPRRTIARAVIGAIGRRELGLEVATPLGGGELWSASWRWTQARPRVAFRADFPVTPGVPGVLGLESSWERFRFAVDTAARATVVDSKRSASLDFDTWLTGGLHPVVRTRFERWSGDRTYAAGSAGLEWRSADDRLVLAAGGEYAAALTADADYGRATGFAMWSSSRGIAEPTVSARAGLEWVSRETPLGNWPIAGGNTSWAIPLRAHPVSKASITGRSVGRRMIHGGLSGDVPLFQAGPVVVAVGVFTDAVAVDAAADGRLEDRFYLDAGGGFRLGLAGVDGGELRIDLARGLAADPRTAISVGIQRHWRLFRQGR